MEGVGQGHMYFPGEYNAQRSEEQHPMLDGTIPHYGGPMVDHAVMDSHMNDPDYVEPTKPSSFIIIIIVAVV